MPSATDSPPPDDDRIAHYDYPLDGVRIATAPVEPRDAARLLVASRSASDARDAHFRDLPDLLAPGDLLVVNDTRVLPVRLFATRTSGGRVEIVLHPSGLDGSDEVLALLRPSARLHAGEWLQVVGGPRVRVVDAPGGELRRVAIEGGLEAALAVGQLPLPPYLERDGEAPADRADYQTLFASVPGAIAAPTAGLHFTTSLCERLAARGIAIARVTLHVGPGTFLPVRVERLRDHAMHEELYELSEATVAAIHTTRSRGGRVIAVGTTTTRALEAAASSGTLVAGRARTRLMIRPPFAFQAIDGLITNFHLPKTTLLALVAAFIGRERLFALYREAAATGYRFYSYGDAMLLT